MRTKQRLLSAAVAFMMTASMIVPVTVYANTGSGSNGDYSSYSVEQLESLIAKLQKQLAEKKLASKCFVSDKLLSLGDGEPGDGMDNDVRRLQMFLKEKSSSGLPSTGYFGKLTRGALVKFQTANGISASGEFDGATRAKAHGMYCKNVLKAKESAKKSEDSKKEKDVVSGVVKSIALSVSEGVARWTTNGTSPSGFKVVWSKNPAPTYPLRDGDRYNYLAEPSAIESTLNPFDGAGTYYVRVCEYLGGKCGVYSNEVSTQL